MHCEKCGNPTTVLDTRDVNPFVTRRRRECSTCGHRITTYEVYSSIYTRYKQLMAPWVTAKKNRIAVFHRNIAICRELHEGWPALSARYALTKAAIYYAAKLGRAGLASINRRK